MVFCRPHIYITAAPNINAMAAPIAIPAIAPPDRPDFLVATTAGAEELVGVVVAEGAVGVIVAPVAVVVRITAEDVSAGK